MEWCDKKENRFWKRGDIPKTELTYWKRKPAT